MSNIFIPDYIFPSILDITPEFLREKGIVFLCLDLDNTVEAYGVSDPRSETLRWVLEMKQAGITLHIVSNSRKTKRVEHYARELDIPYVNKARKPSSKVLLGVIKNYEFEKAGIALAGDQIYTDCLAAHGAGITAIVVSPIKLRNPLHIARYIAEIPFRRKRNS